MGTRDEDPDATTNPRCRMPSWFYQVPYSSGCPRHNSGCTIWPQNWSHFVSRKYGKESLVPTHLCDWFVL